MIVGTYNVTSIKTTCGHSFNRQVFLSVFLSFNLKRFILWIQQSEAFLYPLTSYLLSNRKPSFSTFYDKSIFHNEKRIQVSHIHYNSVKTLSFYSKTSNGVFSFHIYVFYYPSHLIRTELIKAEHVGINFIEDGKCKVQMFK